LSADKVCTRVPVKCELLNYLYYFGVPIINIKYYIILNFINKFIKISNKS